jgi:hypothetical protein
VLGKHNTSYRILKNTPLLYNIFGKVSIMTILIFGQKEEKPSRLVKAYTQNQRKKVSVELLVSIL